MAIRVKDGVSHVVIIPEIPNEDEELKCFVLVLLHVPHRKVSDLRLDRKTWKEAFDFHMKTNEDLRNHASPNGLFSMSLSFKKEVWQERSKLEPDVPIVTMCWVQELFHYDPGLALQRGYGKGLDDGTFCWKCGKLSTELQMCSKCKRARYCSRECQSETWWEHKRTLSSGLACIPNDTSGPSPKQETKQTRTGKKTKEKELSTETMQSIIDMVERSKHQASNPETDNSTAHTGEILNPLALLLQTFQELPPSSQQKIVTTLGQRSSKKES
jgi:hypothetical protein